MILNDIIYVYIKLTNYHLLVYKFFLSLPNLRVLPIQIGYSIVMIHEVVWRGSRPSVFVFRLISYSTPKRQNIFIKCQRLWYITAPIFRQEPTTQEQQTNKITNVKRPCYNFSGPVLFLALIHSKWINRQHAVRV